MATLKTAQDHMEEAETLIVGEFGEGLKKIILSCFVAFLDLLLLALYLYQLLIVWGEWFNVLPPFVKALAILVGLVPFCIFGWRAFSLYLSGRGHCQMENEVVASQRTAHEAELATSYAELRMLDAKARYQDAQSELLFAQANNLRMGRGIPSVLNYDANGNPPIVFDHKSTAFYQFPLGQYKPNVPTNYQVEAVQDRLTDPSKPALGPGKACQPFPFEEAMKLVSPNSLEVCVGRNLATGDPIKVSLPGNNILLLGTSQFGKSTEAAIIMDMLTQTHDPNHLLLSLLDLEDLTCNLFADLPHVLRLEAKGRTIKSVARSHQEVVQHLGYLCDFMDYRYTLTPKDRKGTPHILIYLEEFLELRRRTKGDDLKTLSDRVTTLATRGLKANMHLMVCAQASYSQKEFREAMAQLAGVGIAFTARPPLATAAGFMDYDLLKQNYLAKVRGQFVIESSEGSQIGMAHAYDLKAKIEAKQDEEEALIGAHVEVREELQPQHLIDTHQLRTGPAPTGAHHNTPAWEAYVDVTEKLQNEGHSQDAIIEKIWHAKKGSGNAKYIAGRDIYRLCNKEIKRRRQALFDQSEDDSEEEEGA